MLNDFDLHYGSLTRLCISSINAYDLTLKQSELQPPQSTVRVECHSGAGRGLKQAVPKTLHTIPNQSTWYRTIPTMPSLGQAQSVPTTQLVITPYVFRDSSVRLQHLRS